MQLDMLQRDLEVLCPETDFHVVERTNSGDSFYEC